MRKATIMLVVAVVAGAGLLGLDDSQWAWNIGPSRAFGAKVSMPNEAVGFNGTLLAQLTKPVANGCFTIRVAKVISFAADNKTELTAPALTAVWNGKYVWCGPAANATPCPPLKVGDIVVLVAYQNEMHLRYSSVSKWEKPKPVRPAASMPKPQDPPEAVTAVRDVEYAAVGNKHLLLDIYTPTASQEKLPLVVWIHGGAWRAGSKENPRALGLARRGYAVASINYRLSQAAIFPAQIEDCKAAIRFLRANAAKYSIDGDHVGAWGDSAGGHLAALLGTSGDVKELEGTVGDNLTVSSRVQCVVDYYGPSDMLQFKD